LSSSTTSVTGKGKYLDDINDDNFLHLAIVRSSYAHAKIKSIDFSKITSNSVWAIGPKEVNAACNPIPAIWTAEGMKEALQPVLATGKVRYVGEPVACIIATTREEALDSLELIDVHYEPLKAVIDPESSMRADAPVLHDEKFGDNVGLHVVRTHGDVEKAFDQADVIIRERFKTTRVAPVSMEPRGVISSYDRISGNLMVQSSTQIPYMLKHVLSIILKLPENKIRVVVPNVGGGFGSKDSIYPEEALTSFASIKLGRPVKWVEQRNENLMATNHDRDEVQFVEAAATKEGIVTALRVKILVNAGAYYRFHGGRMVFLVLYMLSGQYKIPNLKAEVFSIFTNTMPTFPYRGPGATEATFLIERVMDLLARKTGLDPVEIRLKNLIRSNEFPYRTATGALYDSGNYEECLKRALEVSEYYEFKREQTAARKNGKYYGIGIACYVEQAGLGPSKMIGSLGIRQGGWEKSTVIVDQSGKVTVVSGIQPIGQGTEHAIATIVGKELGLPPSDVSVLCSDTAFASFGGGAFASRSLAIGGVASALAARKVKEKVLKIAAHMLEARIDDLVFENGVAKVRGSTTKGISLEEIAENAYIMINMPDGMEPGLEASATFDPPNFTFSYGTMIAKVEVDIDTGKVLPVSIHAVHDCGNIILPNIVEGQIHGGIAQGLGEALFEEIVYEPDGQLATGTLADYYIPSAQSMPAVYVLHFETPTAVNPLGVKGVGESGAIGSPTAVAGAVEDALLPFDFKVSELPIRPETILRATNAAFSNSYKPARL
jgi:carbon-monoxide dehydrogenase large subunit